MGNYMTRARRNIIIFDFDGVIIDSFATVFGIWKKVRPQLTEAAYRRQFEGNINAHLDREQPATHFDFFAHYGPEVPNQPLVEDIDTIIKDLSQSYTLAIVSSTISPPIKQFLQRHGLQQYFAKILGNDVAKSKVQKFQMILGQYGLSPSQAILITDTIGDIREASEVGIQAIAVTWGYHDEATLRQGNPAAVAASPTELKKLIAHLLDRGT